MPSFTFDINLKGLLNILEAVRKNPKLLAKTKVLQVLNLFNFRHLLQKCSVM